MAHDIEGMITKHTDSKGQKKKVHQQMIRIIISLGVGVFILWLLYRNMDVDSFVQTLKSDAHFGVLLLAALFGTIGNTFRGMRWQILNKSLSPNPRLINSILTTHGNYLVNIFLPRLGEIWRCGTMAHYSKMSFTALLGTLLVDRAFDLLVILLMFLLGLAINMGFFSDFFSHNPQFLEKIDALMTSPWFYIGLGMLIVALIIFVKSLGRGKFGLKVRAHVKNIFSGVKSVIAMREKWLFVLYTFGIWGGYFLQFYLTFFAFSFTAHLSPAIALVAFVMGAIAVVAPVQAGLGAWHFMIIYTLVFFGIATADAQNFALIVHTSQQLIWTPLVGLVCVGLLPLVNRKQKN